MSTTRTVNRVPVFIQDNNGIEAQQYFALHYGYVPAEPKQYLATIEEKRKKVIEAIKSTNLLSAEQDKLIEKIDTFTEDTKSKINSINEKYTIDLTKIEKKQSVANLTVTDTIRQTLANALNAALVKINKLVDFETLCSLFNTSQITAVRKLNQGQLQYESLFDIFKTLSLTEISNYIATIRSNCKNRPHYWGKSSEEGRILRGHLDLAAEILANNNMKDVFQYSRRHDFAFNGEAMINDKNLAAHESDRTNLLAHTYTNNFSEDYINLVNSVTDNYIDCMNNIDSKVSAALVNEIENFDLPDISALNNGFKVAKTKLLNEISEINNHLANNIAGFNAYIEECTLKIDETNKFRQLSAKSLALINQTLASIKQQLLTQQASLENIETDLNKALTQEQLDQYKNDFESIANTIKQFSLLSFENYNSQDLVGTDNSTNQNNTNEVKKAGTSSYQLMHDFLANASIITQKKLEFIANYEQQFVPHPENKVEIKELAKECTHLEDNQNLLDATIETINTIFLHTETTPEYQADYTALQGQHEQEIRARLNISQQTRRVNEKALIDLIAHILLNNRFWDRKLSAGFYYNNPHNIYVSENCNNLLMELVTAQQQNTSLTNALKSIEEYIRVLAITTNSIAEKKLFAKLLTTFNDKQALTTNDFINTFKISYIDFLPQGDLSAFTFQTDNPYNFNSEHEKHGHTFKREKKSHSTSKILTAVGIGITITALVIGLVLIPHITIPAIIGYGVAAASSTFSVLGITAGAGAILATGTVGAFGAIAAGTIAVGSAIGSFFKWGISKIADKISKARYRRAMDAINIPAPEGQNPNSPTSSFRNKDFVVADLSCHQIELKPATTANNNNLETSVAASHDTSTTAKKQTAKEIKLVDQLVEPIEIASAKLNETSVKTPQASYSNLSKFNLFNNNSFDDRFSADTASFRFS